MGHDRCARDNFGYCGGKAKPNCKPGSCKAFITATEEIKPFVCKAGDSPKKQNQKKSKKKK